MGIKVSKISPYGLKWLEKQPVETKIEMLQFHGDLCKLLANDILEELTRRYTGDKYDRKAESSYYRNGYNPSSMSIGGEKFSVNVPRIRKKDSDQSVNIPEFSEIRDSSAPPERLVRALLSGLSTHDYDSVLGQITDSFGLSSSTVSRRFKEASSEKLQAFLTRDLSAHKFIAMFIDGKYLRSDQVVIALGVTDQGVKVPLGFIQTTTENTKAISQLFTDLINRGFDFSDGFLAIIDGSKGIKSALDKVFGHKAIIQRCRIHKERNVMSYLNDKDQSLWKQRIRKAFMEPTAYAACTSSIQSGLFHRLAKIHFRFCYLNRFPFVFALFSF